MLDFLGIGAQKCGTTWLYEQLRKHPEIAFPAGKEVHFWDQRYAKGIDWYSSLFEGSGLAGKQCGEITPAYAILGRDTIKACHVNFPDLKLIYIIRNPIERAWSSAKMALARAEMELEEASDQWFIDHFWSRGSMMRGDYETCLRNWLAHYPRNQMIVCLFDELIADPESLLRRCFRHVGVSEDLNDWSPELRSKVFATADYSLPARLREELATIYRPKINSLSGYLELDLTGWL